jgi:cell division septation protein DedD
MITVRAGNRAIGICLLLLASACSREQQDWRSAEAADTIESYGQFIQRHPESELVTQARTRVAQLGEDRDWQHAGSADTVDAYREFIAQHPNGKWTQEARIRIENFSLSEQRGTDAGSNRPASRGAAGEPAVADAVGRGSAVPSGTASGVASGKASGVASPAPSVTATGTAAGAVATGTAGHGAGSSASAAARTSAVAAASVAPVTQGPAGMSSAAAQSSTPSGFGIQLGAFSSEASANNEWRALAGRFGPELQGLRQHVVPAETPSGPSMGQRIYRLQAAVGDETRARAICDSLRKRGQACVAVLPH